MKKPKSNDSLSKLRKYFRGIPPFSLMHDLEKVEIRKADLEELLSEYGLNKNFQFFEDLVKWIPSIQISIKKEKEIELDNFEQNNQYFDLFTLVMALQDEQIEQIELKYTTNGLMKGKNYVHFNSALKNGKIIISNSVLLTWIGNILYSEFTKLNEEIHEGNEDEVIVIHKDDAKKGKPNSTYYQALISFGLLQYLNNETELKSGSNFISNDQGKFIYDFLEFSNFLPVESSKVLKEEYIRTLLNNYKGKESFPYK